MAEVQQMRANQAQCWQCGEVVYKEYCMKNRNILFGLAVCLLAAMVLAGFASCSKKDKSYKIGDIGPGGGLVFYDKGSKSDGWQYLEAAPGDLGEAEWGAYRNTVSGTETAIGAGKKNTQLIVAFLKQNNETGCAAQLCDDYVLNGKRDWFLPSKDELDLMYKNIGEQGRGDFGTYYWSSSEDAHSYDAWFQSFSDGHQDYYRKNLGYSVRAVRAF
jgi:hypothetical protein